MHVHDATSKWRQAWDAYAEALCGVHRCEEDGTVRWDGSAEEKKALNVAMLALADRSRGVALAAIELGVAEVPLLLLEKQLRDNAFTVGLSPEPVEYVTAGEAAETAVAQIELRANHWGLTAAEEWSPSVHQEIALGVLARDGRMRTGTLWERISPKHIAKRAHQNAMRDLVAKERVKTAGKGQAIEYWLP